MMELLDYFDPVDSELQILTDPNEHFGNNIQINFSGNILLNNCEIVLFGISSFSADTNEADIIRSKLYPLIKQHKNLTIVDLGNLKKGLSPADSYQAIIDVITELTNAGIIPIIISTNEIVKFAYSALKKDVESISISKISGKMGFDGNASYQSTWFLNESLNNLLSFSHIGSQIYYVVPSYFQKLLKRNEISYRLGEMKDKINLSEPVLRDSHIIQMNIDSIRLSDAPGQLEGSPNGLYSEDFCQLARYSGLSDLGLVYLISGYSLLHDTNFQTALLIAQSIWYIIDGIAGRQKENILAKSKHIKKIIVSLNEGDHDIVFYKSERTGRWWFEVPGNNNCLLFSCTSEDYGMASSNEVPERWLRLYRKIN